MHGAAGIDDQLATQICLLIETLGVQLLGPGKELPIDMPGALAGIVSPVLREFHGESVKRTFMKSYQKAFNHLSGLEFELT